MDTIPIILGAVAIFIAGVWIHSSKKSWSEGVNGFSAFLSSVALIIASYWYFYERPGVPKLNLEVSGSHWKTDQNELLVSVVVRLENVGNTTIVFREGEKLKLDIGYILPAVGSDIKALRAFRGKLKNFEADEFRVIQRDQWPALAYNRTDLAAEIEAGETERYYFKALLDCDRGYVLGLTARVPKKEGFLEGLLGPGEGRDDMVWISQSILDTRDICPLKEGS